MNLLQEKLGYTFRNPKLLDEALTHTSFASEHNLAQNNERLEFLGDSVMGLVVSGYLYGKFPNSDEGFLSKSRAFLVSRETMAEWAYGLRLGFYLHMGAGEIMSGGRERRNNLANAMEAVLGAIYVDGGLEAAKRIILSWLKEQNPENIPEDSKTLLQLQTQKKFRMVPTYETLEASGPEHDKTFKVRVFIGSKTLGLGQGKSLKTAHQAAAHQAILFLQNRKLTKKDLK